MPSPYVSNSCGFSCGGRYGRGGICSLPTGPVRQGKQVGPVQEGSRSGGYGGGLHLHHNQLITSQQTTSEAAKAIFIQGFISIDVLEHTCTDRFLPLFLFTACLDLYYSLFTIFQLILTNTCIDV